jgi:hypothetical protein
MPRFLTRQDEPSLLSSVYQAHGRDLRFDDPNLGDLTTKQRAAKYFPHRKIKSLG